MTGKDWMNIVKLEHTNDLKDYSNALYKLLSWGLFREKWDWTGLSWLKSIIDRELDER